MRRFGEFAGEYPWQWSPGHMDEWSQHLTSEEHLAPSTIRAYQGTLRQFTESLVDGRYGWAAACEEAFGPGRHPVAVCHEWNTIAHRNDYEGEPGGTARITREELQRFLDYADEQVERAVNGRRKGALAAYRDATLFKVMYGWGLRRTETSKLDLADWGRDPAAPEFGRVRHAERPLRQGEEGAAAAAAERGLGDGLGGGGGRRLCRETSVRGSDAGTTRRCG